MTDDQFTLLFLVLIFIAAALVVIAVIVYTLVKAVSVWQTEWTEWKDEWKDVNSQSRKEQTETIDSKLDDVLNELELSDKARETRERRRKERKTDDNTKVQEEGERVFKIKAICELGKMHSQYLHDESAHPDLVADEQKSYEDCKQDALAQARQLTDAITRDLALQFIVDLCMDGKEENEAKRLFGAVEDDLIKEQILAKYPQLAATF